MGVIEKSGCSWFRYVKCDAIEEGYVGILEENWREFYMSFLLGTIAYKASGSFYFLFLTFCLSIPISLYVYITI
jgi:hypothetical protein